MTAKKIYEEEEEFPEFGEGSEYGRKQREEVRISHLYNYLLVISI